MKVENVNSENIERLRPKFCCSVFKEKLNPLPREKLSIFIHILRQPKEKPYDFRNLPTKGRKFQPKGKYDL